MLHARHEDHEEKFLGTAAIPLVHHDQDAVIYLQAAPVESVVLESRMIGDDEGADTGHDSGNESAETDSDSEDKKESMKEIKNALVGMNVSNSNFVKNPSRSFLRCGLSHVFHCVWIMFDKKSSIDTRR